jgi:hypothetical protein
MSRSLFSVLAAAITLGGLAIVVSAARLILRFRPRQTNLIAAALLLAYGAVLFSRPSPWPVIDVAVLAGAAGGALLIQSGLRSPGSVAVFLAVAAAVDLVSMSGGLSRILVEKYRTGASNTLLYLTLVAPIRGRVVPIVGIGDLLVGGAAAIALIRLGLKPLAVMGAISVGLLAALMYGLWRGGAPALPFVAGAVVPLVLWHLSKLKKRDSQAG